MSEQPVIALVSERQTSYSETFIQAHKDLIDARVKYLFGGNLPTASEDEGLLVSQSVTSRIARKLKGQTARDVKVLVQEALENYLLKHKVELVLAEYGPTGVALLPSCKKLNLPLIVHFHGYDASRRSELEKYAEGYKEVFAYASAVVGVSKAMNATLLELGCPKEKLTLNPCGPRDEFYAVQPDYSSQRLVAVGRFVDKKAPYLTLMAFAQLARDFPKAKLSMIGDGPLESACRNLAEVWKVGSQVEFAGVTDRDGILKAYSTTTAFVQHSITAQSGDMEGTPVSVLEASAAGLPVIATRHAGIPDVIIEGETGMLCDEKDIVAMADNMRAVLADPAFAEKLGKAGSKNVLDNFSLDRHIAVLNDLIRNALK